MDSRKNALYALLHDANLTPTEIAAVTLGDVHLAGSEPLVKIWDDQTGQRQTVTLPNRTRDALVAWLVERPDQPSPLLFPGEGGTELSPAEIESILIDFVPPDSLAGAVTPPPVSAETLADEDLPVSPHRTTPPFKAAPPPVSPERLGAHPLPRPKPVHAKPVSPGRMAQQPAITVRWGMLVVGGLAILAVIGILIVGGITLANRRTETPPTATLRAAVAVPTDTSTPKPPTATPKPPTATPAVVSANTPAGENPAQPVATDTPTAIPTPTPAPPADTPVPPTPTPSPTPVPPTHTPVPVANPPASTATPTVGLKYPAPKLVSPEPGYKFIPGNTIELVWESVGELAGNEQYAVRLNYKHNTELVYRGANIKGTRWTIPLELHHDADGPEFDHEWYVYIEAVQPDGKGIPVSPESEHRHFKWE